MDGHKVSVFAYGHTGSGKTYTMQGPATDLAEANMNLTADAGVIPRAVTQVFESARQEEAHGWKFGFHVTMLEIYNDTLTDLLSPDGKGGSGKKEKSGGGSGKIELKLNKDGMPFAQGLCVHKVVDATEVLKLLGLASSRRNVANNGQNTESSRSHSVFTLKVRREMQDQGQKITKEGVLNLIDLAGSERLTPQELSRNPELKRETNAINKSLSTLGRVITAIANKERQVPYRDSKLTFLLKPSLGGNCKTLMFCNIAPDEDQQPETIRSLRFANQVISC